MIRKQLCLIATMVLLIAVPAGAAPVTFELDFEYYGGDEPAGTPPWLVAEFADDGLNQVRLTIDTRGLENGEYVTSWFFNLDPELNAAHLSFTLGSFTGFPATSVTHGNDSENAEGELGQGFDIQFSWSDPDLKFIDDKWIIYNIAFYDPDNPGETFSASSFISSNQGGLASAAHVRGISPDDGDAWIAAVPIPSSVWLFVSGMLGLALLRKRFIA